MLQVKENVYDNHGKPCIVFKNVRISEIHEWLWNNYQDYKFCIIFDETKDEYEEMKEAYVYFLDGVLTEVESYAKTQ